MRCLREIVCDKTNAWKLKSVGADDGNIIYVVGHKQNVMRICMHKICYILT